MNIRFDYLSVADMREQGRELLRQHYEELTLDKQVAKLDVDWVRYENLERSHTLFSLGAFRGTTLVGYAVFIISYNLHYRCLKIAHNDVLFLVPIERKGSTGIRLIQECEHRLANLGVVKLVMHTKKDTVMEKLLPRLGYKHEDTVMGKLLGDNNGL